MIRGLRGFRRLGFSIPGVAVTGKGISDVFDVVLRSSKVPLIPAVFARAQSFRSLDANAATLELGFSEETGCGRDEDFAMLPNG